MNPRTMALLFSCTTKMKERNGKTKTDHTYPYDRYNSEGVFMEKLETEPLFELSFYYKTVKKQGPVFTIFAIRIDSHEEQYSINLEGEDKIVNIMGQFNNDFNMIVSHLRVMNEALVLLNPKKSLLSSPQKTQFSTDKPETQQDDIAELNHP